MKVPKDVILLWFGANAAIPSGFSRETSMDSKYPKGAADAADPNDTGGNATHSHNAAASHGHTMASHTHDLTMGTVVGNESSKADDVRQSATDHDNHPGTFSSGAVNSGALSTVAATYASVSNDPPYYTGIFIKSLGTRAIPPSVVALFQSSSVPSGFQICNGSASSPDLRDKFIKGAAAGADAGDTGGSTTNVHDLTHTHSVAGHTHDAATSPAANRFSQKSVAGSGYVAHTHTHQVGLDSTTVTLAGETITLNTTETVQPAFNKLLAIQNQNDGDSLPLGIIGMWLGTLATIPQGWEVVSSMKGRHLKVANDASEINTTGGSNTHTHAAQNHTHNVSGNHTHTQNGLTHVSAINRTGSQNSATPASATHDQGSVSSVAATYNNGSTSADEQNNEPPYRTVAFIKLVRVASGMSQIIES